MEGRSWKWKFINQFHVFSVCLIKHFHHIRNITTLQASSEMKNGEQGIVKWSEINENNRRNKKTYLFCEGSVHSLKPKSLPFHRNYCTQTWIYILVTNLLFVVNMSWQIWLLRDVMKNSHIWSIHKKVIGD